jgi:Domain of unknown function (DUF4112)
MGAETLRQNVRLRPLTPGQQARLVALRRVAELMDSAFVLPGTTYRIGLDPIIGLVPWIGDLVSPLFTVALLWQARDVRIPKIVLGRMIFNAGVDAVIGAIPFAGDLFDFGWKANQRNMALLERHAYEDHPASLGDWAFVLTTIAIVILLAAVPFFVAGWLISWVAGSVPR